MTFVNPDPAVFVSRLAEGLAGTDGRVGVVCVRTLGPRGLTKPPTECVSGLIGRRKRAVNRRD